jgi:hypothetical protein
LDFAHGVGSGPPLYGNPIIPFLPISSAGCAITDLMLAVWMFAGAPSVFAPRKRAENVNATY